MQTGIYYRNIMNYLKLFLNTFVSQKEPISLIHLITRRCNARCKHCFIDFDNNQFPENELSVEEIEKLTKTFGKLFFSVYIAGGEPFLRRDIFEIVSTYCKNSTAESINIATNGMFTDAVAAFIDKYHHAGLEKRLMFSISIDNFENLHDANRRVPGLYKKALETYKLIESYNDERMIPVIAITVTSYNYKNVVDVYHFLKKSGIHSFTAILMREQGIVKVIEEKEQVLKAHNELVKMIETDQFEGTTVGNGNDILGCYVNARNIVFNNVLSKIYLNQGKSFICSAGTLFGVIFPNGDVRPCEVQENFIMGNLRDYNMNFMKLWNSIDAKSVNYKLRKEKCACTFDGTWAVNIISNIVFFPQLFFYFTINFVKSFQKMIINKK
jgi:MoaA/NifB/PqqE/SkfB family radical SAM enzyme